MQITGNIVCRGSVQIFGRVVGDVHASHVLICDGAQLEGKLRAPDVMIRGQFKGSVEGNSVRLEGKACVSGEIFNKSLRVEDEVQFEGISRRIEKPVEEPAELTVVSSLPTADVIPISEANG
jgi:cytoskeletal protein CcmA (bactofilin family)